MSVKSFAFRRNCSKSDRIRNAFLEWPEGVDAERDIDYLAGPGTNPELRARYQSNDSYHKMDIYFPKGSKAPLPTVVSIHGGGFVYGTKEVYQYYGASWAEMGFTFVNFNYHLAPKAKFPTQLEEVNAVMTWLLANGLEHHVDPEHLFLVGDSAGAQMCSQYAAIATNPRYASLFDFKVPEGLHFQAIALNCGMYRLLPEKVDHTVSGARAKAAEAVGAVSDKLTLDLTKDYLGKGDWEEDPRIDVLSHITIDYPPTYVMTSYYDFLKKNAQPMYEFLKGKKIWTEYKCYGEKGQLHMVHVCHVDMNLKEARLINRDEADFFWRMME